MLLPRGRLAFTRLDLSASVAGLALLVIAVAPGFGNASRNSERAVCINNLQQIGSAFGQFWTDYDNKTPWQALREPGRESNLDLFKVHFHFAVLSNYISGPRIFADPADDRPSFRTAQDWGVGFNTPGLFTPGFEENAVSYFVGLDVNLHTPDSLLAGDHNVTSGGFGGCASQLSTAQKLGGAWTDSVHRFVGNLLFCDGSVRQANTKMLRDAISGPNGPPKQEHVIVPP
jgi:prepilin-type processing-associated H-X9-DG protein